MTIDRIFYVYMALFGAATGAVLVAVPPVQDFALKPYFWILIAVGLFDGAALLRGRNAPGTMLPTLARVIGFGLGIAAMVAVPLLTGTTVRYF